MTEIKTTDDFINAIILYNNSSSCYSIEGTIDYYVNILNSRCFIDKLGITVYRCYKRSNGDEQICPFYELEDKRIIIKNSAYCINFDNSTIAKQIFDKISTDTIKIKIYNKETCINGIDKNKPIIYTFDNLESCAKKIYELNIYSVYNYHLYFNILDTHNSLIKFKTYKTAMSITKMLISLEENKDNHVFDNIYKETTKYRAENDLIKSYSCKSSNLDESDSIESINFQNKRKLENDSYSSENKVAKI